MIGPQLPDQFQPVPAGHRQVQQDDMRRQLAHELHLGTAGCFANHLEVAGAFEDMAQSVAHHSVIVCNDHANHAWVSLQSG
jgi:hypothetical protein